MVAMRIEAKAAHHAGMVAELKAKGTLSFKPVSSWQETVSADGRELHLFVTYEPLNTARLGWAAPIAGMLPECYVFSAAAVAALEGEGNENE